MGGEALVLQLEVEVKQGLVEEACHLVEQVCQAEQAVSPAELEVSEDPWTDACCPGETTCGSASPARCHLQVPPCHWPPVVEAAGCHAGETSWKKSSSADWIPGFPPA